MMVKFLEFLQLFQYFFKRDFIKSYFFFIFFNIIIFWYCGQPMVGPVVKAYWISLTWLYNPCFLSPRLLGSVRCDGEYPWKPETFSFIFPGNPCFSLSFMYKCGYVFLYNYLCPRCMTKIVSDFQFCVCVVVLHNKENVFQKNNGNMQIFII